MKKLFTTSLAALMLMSSLAFVATPAQAQGPALVSSILNKMDRNRRTLKSLRAAMHMQKYNAQLRDEDNSFGEVQYVAGSTGSNSNVRVDWTRPTREMLAVLNGQYTLYRPRLNQAIQGSTKSAKGNAKVSGVLGFGLGISGSQLRNQFDIDLVGEGELYSGSPHVWWLKLKPRGNAGYQFAEVWVTDEGMPIQTRVTEKNGDATTVRLTNVQRNAKIDGNPFEISLPPGTKIVKG